MSQDALTDAAAIAAEAWTAIDLDSYLRSMRHLGKQPADDPVATVALLRQHDPELWQRFDTLGGLLREIERLEGEQR